MTYFQQLKADKYLNYLRIITDIRIAKNDALWAENNALECEDKDAFLDAYLNSESFWCEALEQFLNWVRYQQDIQLLEVLPELERINNSHITVTDNYIDTDCTPKRKVLSPVIVIKEPLDWKTILREQVSKACGKTRP